MKRIAIWLGIVGAALAVIGVVMLTSGVSAAGATGTIACGTATSPDSSQATHDGLRRQLATGSATNYDALNNAACDQAISGRKTTSWVLIGMGVAVLLGAGLAGFRPAPTRERATA